jgi:hypothetical protein
LDGNGPNGLVEFELRADDKTLITVEMAYEPEGLSEQLGSTGGIDERQVSRDLERFKQLVESLGVETGAWCGEIRAGEPQANSFTSRSDALPVSDTRPCSPSSYRYALWVAESAATPDAAEEFDTRVDHLLQTTCEVARALVGSHQAAMAMMVGGDWTQARKYFSLSDKYEEWRDFTMPARGIGLHGIVVSENEAIRLDEDEVEQHPAWRGFADSAGKHPPLRGLLAVPIVGEDGLNYGLLQASDRVDGGDFDEDDELRLQRLADAAAVGLDALRKVRALRLGDSAPAAPIEAEATFVVIESA